MSQIVVIFLLMVFISAAKVNCQRRSTPYDVGCYKKYHRILRSLQSGNFDVQALPTCLEGGVFQVVQCSFIDCHCVFVDTGSKFGNWSLRDHSYADLMQNCPVKTENRIGHCDRPPLHYPCSLSKTKYAYNSATGLCEVAQRGCFGFSTVAECEESCVPPSLPRRPKLEFPECDAHFDIGQHCKKAVKGIRYGYNRRTGVCEVFTYRGCFGNENNYKSDWECQKSCVPQGNVTIRIQKHPNSQYLVTLPDWMVTKYEFSKNEVAKVTRRVFADVRRNALAFMPFTTTTEQPTTTTTSSRLLTEEEIERSRSTPQNICQLPSESGICRGYMPRWYFVPNDRGCKRFVYGGCYGNGNNFKTKHECNQYCGKMKTQTESDREIELVAENVST